MPTVSIYSDTASVGNFMRNYLLPVIAELPGKQQPEAEIAVIEMLENARVHGNHEMPEKEITISWELTPEALVIAVKDEGQGFNKIIPKLPPVTAAHGRGLLTLQDMGYDPVFNTAGNQITITIPRRTNYGRYGRMDQNS
ncbi:MAG: ATP-binding protein [Candidatus Magnetominusculus sp. LBB02]|nr:ATP-binding protein [Candidatus Magnetominusculus sp. LBB02]